MTTRILKCTCKHEYQDRKYGRNNRVHNSMNSDRADWRCTVCSREKSGGGYTPQPSLPIDKKV